MGGIIQWFSCELHAWLARSHKVPSLSAVLLNRSTGVSLLPVTSFPPSDDWKTVPHCITVVFNANILPLLGWYVPTKLSIRRRRLPFHPVLVNLLLKSYSIISKVTFTDLCRGKFYGCAEESSRYVHVHSNISPFSHLYIFQIWQYS